MRISDWSSDVCSSDLLVQGDGLNPASAQGRPTVAVLLRQLEFLEVLKRLGDLLPGGGDLCLDRPDGLLQPLTAVERALDVEPAARAASRHPSSNLPPGRAPTVQAPHFTLQPVR